LAEQRIRVVVSKVGLDGHDRGVKVIAQGLRDAGMEVVYAGLRRTPEELAEITIQEDADVLGLSILSGAVVPLARRVRAALDERDLIDVPIVVGGIVSPDVERQLDEAGVAAAFGPGSPMTDVVAAVERLARDSTARST
jgi:methylmalonyl-CoA mutase C-terminal domain/subunit